MLGSDLHENYLSSLLYLCSGVKNGYNENLCIPHSLSQYSSEELGDVGDGGLLRCVHDKVDTTISCVCIIHVLVAHMPKWLEQPLFTYILNYPYRVYSSTCVVARCEYLAGSQFL